MIGLKVIGHIVIQLITYNFNANHIYRRFIYTDLSQYIMSNDFILNFIDLDGAFKEEDYYR